MENLRLHALVAYLKKHGSATYAELMKEFAVSSATIHRDIVELASRGTISPVRGGALFNKTPAQIEAADPYVDRVVTNRKAKILAAQKALKTIGEGDIVFLDSSTTVYELAHLLRGSKISHLTIVTNSLAIMQNFRKMPREWVLIGLGGNYDSQLNSILGSTAIAELKAFNLTKAFVSAFGLDQNATTNHERQAELLRVVLDTAQKRYLLIDHTKRGRLGLYRIAPRGAFDAVFTD